MTARLPCRTRDRRLTARCDQAQRRVHLRGGADEHGRACCGVLRDRVVRLVDWRGGPVQSVPPGAGGVLRPARVRARWALQSGFLRLGRSGVEGVARFRHGFSNLGNARAMYWSRSTLFDSGELDIYLEGKYREISVAAAEISWYVRHLDSLKADGGRRMLGSRRRMLEQAQLRQPRIRCRGSGRRGSHAAGLRSSAPHTRTGRVAAR